MTRARALLAALAVALAAAAFHAGYAFHGIALFDEGLLADAAARALRGELPVIGATVPYGPATALVLAPCFALFGEDLATLRGVMVAFQALADAALFLAALRTATLPGALLGTALLVVAHGSLHKSPIVVAALLVLLALDRLARCGALAGATGGGALVAAAFLFRHDVGAFGAVAVALAAALEVRSSLRERAAAGARLALGFVAVVGPLVLVALAAGADLGRWWDLEWQRIAVQERIELGGGLAAALDEPRAGRLALQAVLVLAPALHVAWGAGALLRRWRGKVLDGDAARAGAALFGLLLLNQARLVPSANHLFQAFAPVALALADLGARRGRGLVAHGALAAAVAAVTLWAAMGRSGPYAGTFKQRIEGAVELALPGGGVFVRPELAAGLERLAAVAARRVRPDEAIAAGPGVPLVPFLLGRRLAGPFAEPSYYYGSERFQGEVIAALEAQLPPLLVLDDSTPANYPFEQAAPQLAEWLRRRYRPFEQVGSFTLCEPRR